MPQTHPIIGRKCENEIRIWAISSKGGGQFVPPLALKFATAGGTQKLQCWNTEGIFRLIQSITSPKAEPFKRWLARVGKERIDEIENPELSMERMKELYEKKGLSKRGTIAWESAII